MAKNEKRTTKSIVSMVVNIVTPGRFFLLCLIVGGISAKFVWDGWNSYSNIAAAKGQLEGMVRLEKTIMYSDETLTMMTIMGAATGDAGWEKRYQKAEQRLNPSIKDAMSVCENNAVEAGTILITMASSKLTAMESQAFELVRGGHKEGAMTLLKSEEYAKQKQAYKENIAAFVGNVRGMIESWDAKNRSLVMRTISWAGIVLSAMICGWLILFAARSRVRERMYAKQTFNAFAREWQETFDAITDAVCLIEKKEGKIIRCNKATASLVGKPYGEISGRNYCEVIYGTKEPIKDCPLVRMWRSGRSEEASLPMGKRWFHIKADPVINEAGNIVGAVHIISDITEQRKVEKSLEENEAKFRLAFENAQDAIVWVEKATGTIVNCNKAAETLFGRPTNNIVGQHFTILHPVEQAEYYKTLVNELGEGVKNNAEAEIVTKSGEIKTVILAASTMQVSGKEIIQKIIRDITERKKAEQEKIEFELQISQKQKMEAIGTLAGGVAHDFNNILAAMRGYVELTIEDLPEGAAVRENLEQVLTCAERGAKLIRQILTFSRTEKGEKVPVNIGSIVIEVLKMLKASLPATIKICRRIETETSFAMADATQMHQVLLNLCTNAAHAMREKGGQLEVRLSNIDIESQMKIGDEVMGAGPYIKLSVSDTGSGMSEEIIGKIFEPFFTTKKKGEGTGLGLSVVHGIIKSHSGAITVSSKVNEGTTFDIYLPRIENYEGQKNEAGDSTTDDEKVILLVDDEEMTIDLTKQILERLGYKVISKTSSVEAFEIFQEKGDEFDLVITDQVMPKMMGTQLAKELIAIKPDIPVILCAAADENVQQGEVERLGIKMLVTKPVNKEEIAAVISKVLEKQAITA